MRKACINNRSISVKKLERIYKPIHIARISFPYSGELQLCVNKRKLFLRTLSNTRASITGIITPYNTDSKPMKIGILEFVKLIVGINSKITRANLHPIRTRPKTTDLLRLEDNISSMKVKRAKKKYNLMQVNIRNSIPLCEKQKEISKLERTTKSSSSIKARATTPGIAVMTSTEDILLKNPRKLNLYSLIKISQFAVRRASSQEWGFIKGKQHICPRKSIYKEVIRVPSIKLLLNTAIN